MLTVLKQRHQKAVITSSTLESLLVPDPPQEDLDEVGHVNYKIDAANLAKSNSGDDCRPGVMSAHRTPQPIKRRLDSMLTVLQIMASKGHHHRAQRS
jgi:hypothetical protein